MPMIDSTSLCTRSAITPLSAFALQANCCELLVSQRYDFVSNTSDLPYLDAGTDRTWVRHTERTLAALPSRFVRILDRVFAATSFIASHVVGDPMCIFVQRTYNP